MILTSRRILGAMLIVILGLVGLVPFQPLLAQTGTTKLVWSRPIPLSGALQGSWYPSLVATDDGKILLLWGENSSAEPSPTLYTSKFQDGVWSRPIDVLLGGPTSRAELDGRGDVTVLYSDGTNLTLATAPFEDANTAQGWNPGMTLNHSKGGAIGDFVADPNGTLHALWFETSPECADCLQVAYEQNPGSPDTNSTYHIVSDSEKPTGNLQLLHAASGTLYAMWDSPAGNAKAGVKLQISKDNGATWLSQPIIVTNSDGDLRKPYLFIDSANNLVLVYDLGVKDETFYQVSADDGATWSAYAPIPGLLANKPSVSNDYFRAATDGSGIVHLIGAGRTSKDQVVPGVYHVTWDGKKWTPPDTIYLENQYPEMPAITIGNGNTLYVSFTTRDRNHISSDPDDSSQVWFSKAQTTAQAATRIPLPTFTPIPTDTPGPTDTPLATATPTPTPLTVASTPGDSTPADTVNPQLPLIYAIIPVVAILALVVLVNFLLRRR